MVVYKHAQGEIIYLTIKRLNHTEAAGIWIFKATFYTASEKCQNWTSLEHKLPHDNQTLTGYKSKLRLVERTRMLWNHAESHAAIKYI